MEAGGFGPSPIQYFAVSCIGLLVIVVHRHHANTNGIFIPRSVFLYQALCAGKEQCGDNMPATGVLMCNCIPPGVMQPRQQHRQQHQVGHRGNHQGKRGQPAQRLGPAKATEDENTEACYQYQ